MPEPSVWEAVITSAHVVHFCALSSWSSLDWFYVSFKDRSSCVKVEKF